MKNVASDETAARSGKNGKAAKRKRGETYALYVPKSSYLSDCIMQMGVYQNNSPVFVCKSLCFVQFHACLQHHKRSSSYLAGVAVGGLNMSNENIDGFLCTQFNCMRFGKRSDQHQKSHKFWWHGNLSEIHFDRLTKLQSIFGGKRISGNFQSDTMGPIHAQDSRRGIFKDRLLFPFCISKLHMNKARE